MMRKFARRLIRSLGYDGMERDRFDRLLATEQACLTYPRLLRDFFLLHVERMPHLYFLHLGANDGVKDNFTAFLREPANVESILVEPQRPCLPKLAALQTQNPRIRVLPLAFGQTDGEALLYRFDHEFEKGIQLDVFSSFDRAMLEEKKNYFSLKSAIVSDRVETGTLPTLLARGGAPRLDILVCDIEGLDHQVIEQLVTKIRPLPIIVVFEQRWLTVEQRRHTYQLLDAHGYAVLHGAEDAWCFRRRLEDEVPLPA